MFKEYRKGWKAIDEFRREVERDRIILEERMSCNNFWGRDEADRRRKKEREELDDYLKKEIEASIREVEMDFSNVEGKQEYIEEDENEMMLEEDKNRMLWETKVENMIKKDKINSEVDKVDLKEEYIERDKGKIKTELDEVSGKWLDKNRKLKKR